MIEFQTIYEAFRVWTLFAVLAGLIGIGIFIYGLSKSKRLKMLGIMLFGHMFLCGMILLLLNNIFSSRAKLELLQTLSDSKLNVTLCNEPVNKEKQSSIISELKLLRDIPRHHSQPLDTVPIKILKNDTDIRIRIQRDSDRENEYWIYWDKYKITKENAVGYIQTLKFDNTKCR